MNRHSRFRHPVCLFVAAVLFTACAGEGSAPGDDANASAIAVPTSSEPPTEASPSGMVASATTQSTDGTSPDGTASAPATTVPGSSEPATTAPAATPPATTTPAAADGDFCDDFEEFLRAWSAGEFGPVELTERYRSLANVAPAGLADTLAFMENANEILLETGNPDDVPGGQEAYDAAGATLQRFATDDCGLELP